MLAKFSNPQIIVGGFLAGFIALFGHKLIQIGGFLLFFSECGKTAGFFLKVVGVLCFVLYVFSVIGFLLSIPYLFISRKSAFKNKSLVLVVWLIFLSFGIYKTSHFFSVSRKEDAVFKGDLELYKRISTDFDSRKLSDDLWVAARWGHIELVKYLVSRGADPNAQFGGEGSSIVEAAHENLGKKPEGNKEVIDYLTSSGAVKPKEHR